jgi:signal transduction histidine kinase
MKKLEDMGREELLLTVRSLLGEAEALSSRIAAVNEIGIAINRTFDLGEILRVVSRQAKWLLDFDYLSVCLPDKAQKDAWRIVTLFGPTAEYDTNGLAETNNLGHVLKTGQSRLIREGCESAFLRAYLSQIIIPLNTEDHVTGAIIFASVKAQHYRQEDMRIGYLLALQLASALRNASQFEQIKQAQAELRLYAQELEVRNQELDAYNHTIAHDLKSPLTGITLKAEVVKMLFRDLPPDAIKQLDDIKDSALKMADMIDQLLWLTKLRDATASAESVHVDQVVQSALSRFQHQIEQASIAVEVAPAFPPALGHAQWIEEVFANLISNAIKYMGKDNPAPRIKISGSRQADMARYEVCDTGVGITPEDQAHLFEMFTRLHTVEAEGLGLGLSIVHRIVSKLNGHIGVESERGKGSAFWFTLPAAD